MGRELKRVPMDFDAPLNEVWRGYLIGNASKEDYAKFPVKSCDECRKKYEGTEGFCMEEETPYCIFYNSEWRDKWFEEVPEGEGYQLWETTSEGSPQTPVFATLEELCEYAAENVSYFASEMMSKEHWFESLSKGIPILPVFIRKSG